MPETETNTSVSFYSMRIYWIKINSQGWGVLMVAICQVKFAYSSNLTVANAGSYSPILITNINSHTTQHTVDTSIHAHVWVTEWIQVSEAAEGVKRFLRRTEKNSREVWIEKEFRKDEAVAIETEEEEESGLTAKTSSTVEMTGQNQVRAGLGLNGQACRQSESWVPKQSRSPKDSGRVSACESLMHTRIRYQVIKWLGTMPSQS